MIGVPDASRNPGPEDGSVTLAPLSRLVATMKIGPAVIDVNPNPVDPENVIIL
jgi:hypothetical protein